MHAFLAGQSIFAIYYMQSGIRNYSYDTVLQSRFQSAKWKPCTEMGNNTLLNNDAKNFSLGTIYCVVQNAAAAAVSKTTRAGKFKSTYRCNARYLHTRLLLKRDVASRKGNSFRSMMCSSICARGSGTRKAAQQSCLYGLQIFFWF